MKPVVLTLKFKTPAEFKTYGECNNLHDDYYSKYFRDNISDAEVIEMTDYNGEPDNQAEGIEPGQSENYYVDVATFVKDDVDSKEIAFEELKREVQKEPYSEYFYFKVCVISHHQVENNNYLFLKGVNFDKVYEDLNQRNSF